MILILMLILITPGLISTMIYSSIVRRKEISIDFIVDCAIFSLLIIFINYVFILLRNHMYISFDLNGYSDFYNTKFVVKYIGISLIFSLILPKLRILIENIDYQKLWRVIFKTTNDKQYLYNFESNDNTEAYIDEYMNFYSGLPFHKIQNLKNMVNNSREKDSVIFLFCEIDELINSIKNSKFNIIKNKKEIEEINLKENDLIIAITDKTDYEYVKKMIDKYKRQCIWILPQRSNKNNKKTENNLIELPLYQSSEISQQAINFQKNLWTSIIEML